jgi:arsenite methyltransferase
MQSREYYGIDAPVVVCKLSLGGVALVVAGIIFVALGFDVENSLALAGLCMMLAAAWMLISSLWLKAMVMRSMLDERNWRGDEVVLDVGSGKGLVAIEAAKRALEGRVYAIDLWSRDDLSSNGPEALLANARLARVDRRIAISTGDARKLPYADRTFDVATSMTAIHNIRDLQGRQAAISEIWRVTKPGGQILIFDIWYARAYLRHLRILGATDARLLGPVFLWAMVGWKAVARKPIG